jgi:Polysaccharide pyruvyl transferase
VRRILIRSFKDPFRAASAEETLAKNLIGDNVGNLVFSQATYRLLATRDAQMSTSRLSRPSAHRIDEKYDHLVIPLANAFRVSFLSGLDALSDLIERLTIPVSVVSVGAQATVEGSYKHADDIAPSVRRFVRAVLDRSPSIGVRGEFTRDYLRDLGFGDEHVDVVGCPSLFMYGPNLSIKKKVEALTEQSRIALNVSPYVKAIGPVAFDQATRYPNLVYMAQNRDTLALLLYGTYPEVNHRNNAAVGVPVSLEHPLIREDRVRFFLDPHTWFTTLADYDFSFGTRIHGNIAALLAGTPGLVLAHDSRTLELAEYHRIPWRRLLRDARLDATELYAEADWEPMNGSHSANWERFSAFLSKHGLRHVYEDGEEGGADFDAALAAVDFPPPVRTLMGAEPEELYALKQALTDCQSSSLASRSVAMRQRGLSLSKTGFRRARTAWRQAKRKWGRRQNAV